MINKKQCLTIVLIIISIIIFGIFISILYSYSNLISREYNIYSKDVKDSALAENDGERSEDSICLVALSDLHGRMIGKDYDKLVRKVKKQNPDLIVLLGDMIDQVQESDCDSLLILTRKLCQLAPVYWVEGNHEPGLPEANARLTDKQFFLYGRMKKDMADAGAVLLSQNYQTISIRDRSINLCGISTHYYWGDEEAAIMSDFKQLPGIKVLLCHYPESIIWYKAFEGGGLDLALCGHTHGGLMRVPFNGGLYAPEQGWRPYYDLGAYPIYQDNRLGDPEGKIHSEYLGTMIISSGLSGEHGLPRVNNPTEITVVNIY